MIYIVLKLYLIVYYVVKSVNVIIDCSYCIFIYNDHQFELIIKIKLKAAVECNKICCLRLFCKFSNTLLTSGLKCVNNHQITQIYTCSLISSKIIYLIFTKKYDKLGCYCRKNLNKPNIYT